MPAWLKLLPMAEREAAQQAARSICAAGDLLWEREMVASNDGNISARLPGGQVLCTPTGMSKRGMRADNLVLLEPSGTVLAGAQKPSSEVKMHLQVYQEDPDVQGVVHAHPTFATVYAVRGEAPPTDLVAETIVLMPTIPVAPFAVPSTAEVPASIAGLVAGNHVCLLEHHGALSWGLDVMDAYFHMERLEHIAKLAYYAQLARTARPVSQEHRAQIAAVFPEATAGY